MEQYGLVFEGYMSAEREPIERQIAATDKKIDELVQRTPSECTSLQFIPPLAGG